MAEYMQKYFNISLSAGKILLSNFPIFNRLRAQFGTDTMKNAVHGSSTVEMAEKVIKEFLPEVEILPDGTVRGLYMAFLCQR